MHMSRQVRSRTEGSLKVKLPFASERQASASQRTAREMTTPALNMAIQGHLRTTYTCSGRYKMCSAALNVPPRSLAGRTGVSQRWFAAN